MEESPRGGRPLWSRGSTAESSRPVKGLNDGMESGSSKEDCRSNISDEFEEGGRSLERPGS